MKANLECGVNRDVCLLLPSLALAAVKCEHCDEDHGLAIEFGWLWFSVAVVFRTED